MHSHQVQIILLILSFFLSLFLVVASAKYAEWARIMVSGQPSGSWLGLVFYIGSIPLLSLLFTTFHLVALHFDLLPSHLPNATTTHQSQTGYPISPTPYLLAVLTTIAQAIMWLGQSSISTACELSPILAGHQGNVPQWCPQSHFRDTTNSDLPDMLSQLAIVKDIASWAMVPLSAVLVECVRRQWARARIASGEGKGLEGGAGLREYEHEWKSGVSAAVAVAGRDAPPSYEMGSIGRKMSLAKPLPVEPAVVEMGAPPSRKDTYEQRGYGRGNGSRMQGVSVGAGYAVGASYETRF